MFNLIKHDFYGEFPNSQIVSTAKKSSLSKNVVLLTHNGIGYYGLRANDGHVAMDARGRILER